MAAYDVSLDPIQEVETKNEDTVKKMETDEAMEEQKKPERQSCIKYGPD